LKKTGPFFFGLHPVLRRNIDFNSVDRLTKPQAERAVHGGRAIPAESRISRQFSVLAPGGETRRRQEHLLPSCRADVARDVRATTATSCKEWQDETCSSRRGSSGNGERDTRSRAQDGRRTRHNRLECAVTATSRTDGAIFPKLGDSVTFGVSFPRSAQKYDPRIQVLCYQNGDLVYGEAGPYYQEFLLGGAMSLWFLGDGAASCHADLYYWSYQGSQKFNLLASTEFDAAGR
jgi:hypothetical protein